MFFGVLICLGSYVATTTVIDVTLQQATPKPITATFWDPVDFYTVHQYVEGTALRAALQPHRPVIRQYEKVTQPVDVIEFTTTHAIRFGVASSSTSVMFINRGTADVVCVVITTAQPPRCVDVRFAKVSRQ